MIGVRRLPVLHTAKDRNALRVKSNRTRILAALVLVATALVARPAVGQVGFPPDASPYRYIEGNKILGLSAGYVWGDLGTAGVGPSNGTVITGRFDIQLTAALGVNTPEPTEPGARAGRARPGPHAD